MSRDNTHPSTSPAGHRGHIAVVGIPAHGHVNPGLAVIRELVERGYRVSYATTDAFAATVAATGATVVPYTSLLPREDDPEQSWPDDAIEAMNLFLRESQAVLPQLEAVWEADRPDLFLYDIAGYPGRLMAEKWGVPAVQLSPTYVAWEGYQEDMADFLGPLFASPAGVAYQGEFTRWLRENGVGLTPDDFTGRPRRCVVLIPKAMQPNAERVSEEVYTFVGPCAGDRADQGGWRTPEDGRPVLLVTLGSAYTNQPEFFRACIAAFGDSRWHVVMSIGRYVDEAALGPVPDNVEVHRWVPQFSVLSQADAFITHAGMGGTVEGLYHGVPMVAVPQAVDQFGNAERIRELGVGRHVPTEEATPEVLREAVDALTADPEVAARLAAIRAEMRREGGTPRAADLIEAELRARRGA
ncbi:macrolide family glycosyltransferase [Allostreptomyces psammosilenae]|uniref:MGT family glycosyltransferase n=1 Tax=Allostreptomyces psammosilenae TaxID=1892865 RepID=A0A852ZUF5_9ACTN|nr:macrolide family glycosyltransferase [Allostreptomyces psammosilenae]NYI04404.1 MGT family glycosyltransferase [Allostreptomyces psammosilenae]